MCVGRLTCSPADALWARPAMCGALGRASVNSGAANQRSPNDVDPLVVREALPVNHRARQLLEKDELGNLVVIFVIALSRD